MGLYSRKIVLNLYAGQGTADQFPRFAWSVQIIIVFGLPCIARDTPVGAY